MKAARIIRETTLDVFDEIYNDGTLGEMQMKALQLVQDNPDLTVRELLEIGVTRGIYSAADRNIIAPRITSLAEECVIVRPVKRKCSVTGRTVMTHRVAPESWREQRQRCISTRPRNYVQHRMEIPSKSRPGIFHTVVMWSDGSVSCTCHDTYHRSYEHRCAHAIGMITAVTGRVPDWAIEKEKGAA